MSPQVHISLSELWWQGVRATESSEVMMRNANIGSLCDE